MMQIFYFILILSVCLIIGKRVFLRLGCKFDSYFEEVFMSLSIGVGILAVITFFLGIIGLLYKSLFLTSFVIILILYFKEILSLVAILFNSAKGFDLKRIKPSLSFKGFLVFITLILVMLNFFSVFAPISEMDSIAYHLAVPKLFAMHHKIYYLPDIRLSNFPFFTEMLFTLGILLSDAHLAVMFTPFFSILSIFGVYLFTKKFLSKRAALIASVIYYSLPIISERSSQAMVEIPLAFYTLASLYTLFLWMESNNNSWLITTAIFSGFVAGIKLTGPIHIFSVFFIIGYWLLIRKHKSIAYTFKQLSIYLGISMVIVLPWYIKNIAYTGNPVYPMMYNVFGGRYWSPYLSEYLAKALNEYGFGRSFMDFILLPWNLTMHGTAFDAVTGITPIFLAFVPFIFFQKENKNKSNFLLFYSLVFILHWFFLSQQSRYLLPIFLILSIIASHSFIGIFDRLSGFRSILISLIIFMLLFNVLLSFGINIKKLPVVFGIESKEDYLENLKDYNPYNVSMFINSLHKSSKTLLIGLHRTFYIDNDYVVGNPELQAYIDYSQIKNESAFSDRLKEIEITHIAVDLTFNKGIIEEKIPYLNNFLDNNALLIYEHKGVRVYELKKNLLQCNP